MVQSPFAVSDEELMRISSQNPGMNFERNADGTLVAMSPTGGISGNREARAGAYLLVWVETNELGAVFSSSTGFKLPNGAVRSPDAAFVARDRLPPGWEDREDTFVGLAPDFAIEIRSKTDSLEALQAKMREYIANGVQLGWLCDRQSQQVWVYRSDGSITQYPVTATLSADPVVPGFTLAAKKLL